MLIFLTLYPLLIFSFSLQPADASASLSSGFGTWLVQTFLPALWEQMQTWTPEQLEYCHFLLRKAAHFTEFFVLGALAITSFRRLCKRGGHFISMAYCIFIACIDEIIQLFVDGRAGRLSDVILDSCGSFTGIYLVLFFFCLLERLRTRQ